MTTLDSATRITRYIGEEFFGDALGIGLFRNPYFNTAVVIGFALWLSLGSWQAIWPVFGAANQLVAALALFVVTAWLLGRNKSIKYTIYPALFMLITTVAALVYQLFGFMDQGKIGLSVIAAVLIVLAVFMLLEVVNVIRKRSRNSAPLS
jgi:carbon starvation protein